MFRAILLDLDNTLVERDAAHRRYVEELLARIGVTGARHAEILAEMIAEDRGGHRDRMDFCAAVTARIPELAMSPEQFWAGYGPGMLRYFAPRPRLNAMLERLAVRHRLVLVSNGSGARQREKLKRAELERFFQKSAVIISGEAGVKKPDRKIFELALGSAGCSAEAALFVGDDPERDIAGAHLAGMKTCWVAGARTMRDYPAHLPKPAWRIQGIEELGEVLA